MRLVREFFQRLKNTQIQPYHLPQSPHEVSSLHLHSASGACLSLLPLLWQPLNPSRSLATSSDWENRQDILALQNEFQTKPSSKASNEKCVSIIMGRNKDPRLLYQWQTTKRLSACLGSNLQSPLSELHDLEQIAEMIHAKHLEQRLSQCKCSINGAYYCYYLLSPCYTSHTVLIAFHKLYRYISGTSPLAKYYYYSQPTSWIERSRGCSMTSGIWRKHSAHIHQVYHHLHHQEYKKSHSLYMALLENANLGIPVAKERILNTVEMTSLGISFWEHLSHLPFWNIHRVGRHNELSA